MKKLLLAMAVGLGVLLLLPDSSSAQSRRSSSSGSRSFSSGSRSSSSSSSKPSGRSFSSGSGSSSSRPSSSSSKPSAKSFTPSGKSFSSGTSAPSGSSTSTKPSGSYDRGAAGAQRKEESRSIFSGSRNTPTPSGKGVATGSPSRNGSAPGPGTPSPGGAAGKKPSGSYDSTAAAAQRKEESRSVYTKGAAPQPTYTDPRGTVRPIDPQDRRVEQLRRELDRERWANRELRRRQFYGGYYTQPGPVVVYNDPYSSFFWWWLLAQSLDVQARWAYHHRHSMDEARYHELRSRNTQLEERIRQLEAKGVARDPTYRPEGMPEPDLMYTDEYVTAAYNPQPPPAQHTPRPARGSSAAWVLFKVCLVLAALWFAIWFIFFKRWGGT